MAEHSLLSPSSSAQWLNCSASLWACKGIEQKESEYANEGTAAHSLAYSCLKNGTNPSEYEGIDGKFISLDMFDPVLIYVKNIRRQIKKASWYDFETQVDLSGVLGVPECKGTADALAIVGKTLIVNDLKYGKGVVVSPVKNTQMMLYALGALEIAELISSIIKVKLIIHQPRVVEEPQEWIIPVKELREFQDYACGQANLALKIYESGEVLPQHYSPGEKTCQWCAIKATCEYRLKFVTKDVIDDFENLDATNLEVVKSSLPAISTAEQIAKVLNIRGQLREFLNDVDDKAMSMMLNGEKIPGFKLVEGRQGNRKWSDEAKVIGQMRSFRMTNDDIFDMKLISPAKAEKKLGDVRWKKIESLITREPGGKQIVPESDNRPEFIPNAVDADFEDLTQTRE